MRITLLFFFLACYYQGYAQCPNTHTVNFSAKADTSVSITAPRFGDCNGDKNCINFAITANSGTDLINFNADQITGASFYSINGGPQIPIGTPACIAGLTNVFISFCKPGNNIVTYTITASTSVKASDDLTLRQGCTGVMSVTGLQPASTSWTSIFPGAEGAYNSYLSQTSGVTTVNVTPQVGSPAYIDYKVSGNQNTVCSGIKSDTVRVYATPALTVAITPSNPVICGGTSVQITATPTGGNPSYGYSWNTGATTQSINVNTPGTYTVSVTDNTTGCAPVTQQVDVTAAPTPSPPTASGTTICSGSTATLIATAPGGTYQWYDASSGGNLLGTGAAYITPALTVNTTYYVQTTVGICTSLRTPVTVSVAPIPAVPTASGTTICSGSTATLTATAPGGTYQWYDAASGGNLLGTGADYITPALTVNTTYYVQTTVNGCTSARTAVTVSITPIPAAPTVSGATICSGTTTTLTATAPGGAYQWYDAASGGNLLGTSAAYTTPVLTANTTYYVQITVNGCTSARTAVTVSVTPIPAAPTVSGATICSGTTATLTATAPGGTYQWYDAASGGNLLGTGAAYITPALTVNTTYYVQTTVNGCTSLRTPATVSVTPIPAAPTASGTTICSGTITTLTATAPGGTYQWYDAASGGNLLGTGATYITPALTVNTTYYVQTTVNGCTSARTAVTVSITPIPAAPTASGTTICSGSTATLTATAPGGTYQWYDTASGGNLLGTGAAYTTPILTATTTYYVQTTVNGCTSARTPVTVSVTPIPAAPTASGTTICSGSAATLTATAPGGTYQWYDASSGGNLLGTGAAYITPALTVNTTYYVQTTVNGCTSARTAVTVSVTPIPAAPTASGATICSGTITTLTATAPGGTYQWYDAASGGNLLRTGAAYTTPVLTATTTYYVQTTVNGCISARTAVTVTVNPIIDPEFKYSSGTYCKSGPGTTPPPDIFISVGGTFSAAPAGLVFVSTSTGAIDVIASAVGTYVVTFTNSSPCPRSTTANITITNTPLATFSYSGPFCQRENNPLPSFPAGSSAGVFSASSPGLVFFNTSTGEINLDASLPGTYTITNTIAANGGCAAALATFTVIVNPTPAAPEINSNSPVCNGSSINLSTPKVAGASYLWTGPNGFTSNVQNPIINGVTRANAGVYRVTITVNGCTSSPGSTTVFVNDLPVANAGNDQTVCVTAGTITLAGIVSGGSSTGVWTSNGSGTFLSSNILNTIYIPSAADRTALRIILTLTSINNGSCMASVSSLVITLQKSPMVNAGPDQTLCSNNATVSLNGGLTNASGGVWNSSGTGRFSPFNTSLNAIYIPSQSDITNGSVILTLKSTGNAFCSPTTDATKVTIIPATIVNAGADKLILEKSSTILDPEVNDPNVQYLWTPNINLNNNTVKNPVVTGAEDQLYTLRVTNSRGCVTEDKVFVKVLKPIIIPNTFTPNGDGVNDVWNIAQLASYPGATVHVYNRYGVKIYDSIGYHQPWDGTYNGSPMPVGTYYYIIDTQFPGQVFSGYIAILR